MPARRLPLLFLIAAGPIVAAQGPLTSSLVDDPTSTSTTLTTIRTTVVITLTTPSPPTIITLDPPSFTTTTTLFVTSPPPETTTTTIRADSSTSSSSSHVPSSVLNTPIASGTLVPSPTNSSSLARSPGALAGLIVGLCVAVVGVLALAWFTIKRHRLRELESHSFDPPPIGSARHSASVGEALPSNRRSRTIDGDLDLDIQSSIGHEMRSSPVGHSAIVSSPPGVVSPRESPDRVDYEIGYIATHTTGASSNGHSSHGHGTINSRNPSFTQINGGSRNTSPTLSRQNPNRTRFSLSPGPMPSAWYPSRPEIPSRRRSVDDVPTLPWNPHRVNSEPVTLNDTPQLMSIYPRRQSSELPRSDVLPWPGPPILVHTPPPNPPSSLLRPPSATQIPTLQTLQRSQPSAIYLDLPFMNQQIPSPAASNISVLSGREGLLGTPPNPTESLSSLRDDHDYSRRLGVSSGLRDSTGMADADSDSEVHPNRDFTHRHLTLG